MQARCKDVSARLKAKPFSPRELLVKHVAFAAEFGASPALRPQSIDMNFVEYFNLDIIAIIVVMVVTVLYLVAKLESRLLSRTVHVKSEKD